MKELKIVVFNENNFPRSFSVKGKHLNRLIAAQGLLIFLLLIGWMLATRYFFKTGTNFTQTNVMTTGDIASEGPSNSLEDQNKFLKDEVDRLKSKLEIATKFDFKNQPLERTNPALNLFPPVVVDHTKNQELIHTRNFKYAYSTTEPTYFTFELHNNSGNEVAQKGYIVVLARTNRALYAYPDVFSQAGPNLIDFEKGETFQVARFRMVNAQFKLLEPPQSFQVFLFTRAGELIVNTNYEVKSGSTN